MEEKLCALFVISGFAVLCPWVSGSISDVRVKPRGNITVVCDCECPTGVYAVWYRISQQNQPTLVLKTKRGDHHQLLNGSRDESWINPYPRFQFLKNTKSKCYNLHITNMTESDEGLYLCGTETTKVQGGNQIDFKSMYTFGNATTRLLIRIVSSWLPVSGVDVTVRAGDNITLRCDCPLSVGALTVWYRNCSHMYQPSLVLRVTLESAYQPNKSKNAWTSPLPGYHFVRNYTSNSYDLLISNTTEADVGVYFCGTVTRTLEEQNCLVESHKYTYGKASTRIIIKAPEYTVSSDNPQCCGGCWTWLLSLCPTFALSFLLLTVVLVYFGWLKRGPRTEDPEAQMGQNEEEDVSYAALEVHQLSQKPKKKRTLASSDFSTYSAVKTSSAQV